MICPKCQCEKLWELSTKAESGRTRWKCSKCKHRTTNPDQDEIRTIEFETRIPRSNKYIFTAAQNATPVHKKFFKSLTLYARHIGAELIVIPFRYRNPTSQWTADNESHEWWSSEIMPHLYDGRFDLNQNLTVLGDIKVTPTAVTPLTGLESLSGERSGIVGHTKIQLMTIPTPQNKLPKIMTTTGAVTVKNYSDTKAGKKGEFHHSLGASMVELSGQKFHLRQISANNDGSFIDLNKSVSDKGVKKAPPAEALIMGDTHTDFIDPKVVSATFTDKNSIVKTLRPKKLIWHDLIDFYSRSHHHKFDPIKALATFKADMGSVEQEMRRAYAFVDRHTPKYSESIFIPSNHNEGPARWIRETDWRMDPLNAEFYLETALVVVRSAKLNTGGTYAIDPFLYWAERMLKKPAVLLERNESYIVKDIECALHGDKGANGARGYIRSFAKIGTKSVIGHSHSPGISDGCYQTGTSSYLHRDYAIGLSSWLQTHCVIYANGKRSLISIIDGSYRA